MHRADLGPSTESNRVLNEYDYFTSLCTRTCTPLKFGGLSITRNCNPLVSKKYSLKGERLLNESF